MSRFKLRELRPFGEVIVYLDGVEIHRLPEYRGAIAYLKSHHGLSEAECLALFDSYRKDYGGL
ncbi:hypothetical protein AB5I39_10310 [Sphingomonas sp. MMS24-J45]|uniref:hypothetical protein n=1 Tax=Sphingomonas sp. MMS24-J45 TaxID=3238806 RepID=UPI00385042BA